MWWLVLIVFGLMIPEILSTVLESRLGRAVAAHIENRGKTAETGALAERVRSLEGEVDRLSGEVQRLTDETEFFQRLLSERSAGPGPRPTSGDPSS
jgi:hypothetical protein